MRGFIDYFAHDWGKRAGCIGSLCGYTADDELNKRQQSEHRTRAKVTAAAAECRVKAKTNFASGCTILSPLP